MIYIRFLYFFSLDISFEQYKMRVAHFETMQYLNNTKYALRFLYCLNTRHF
jgi:hypothetical protein